MREGGVVEALPVQGDAVTQAWLQVAGLIVDFIGVSLIAIEWLIAQRGERRLLEIETRRSTSDDGRQRMMRQSRNMPPEMVRHLETVSEMERRMAMQRTEQSRSEVGRLRVKVIVVGLMFVLIGFALQLAGAWPGCCSWAGITPSAN